MTEIIMNKKSNEDFNQYQSRLVELILDIENNESFQNGQYSSVLGLVYTLIQEQRTGELSEVLRNNFPEYFC
jgi:hypothetical protein